MDRNKYISMFLYVMRHIRLTDAYLLIFMVLLLLESVYILFFYELAGSDASTIDVVARTTAAAIFGYFIGGGFLRDDGKSDEKKSDAETNSLRGSEIDTFEQGPLRYLKQRCKQQVVIVGSIGIFSLLVLIIVNNCLVSLPSTAVATVSQLRDFVSGSVGLLIGNSTRGKLQ